MASIKEYGNCYLITVSLGFDKNKKRIRKRVSFTPATPITAPAKRKKEVEDFARDFERRVKEGTYYDGDGLRFSEFVEIWKSAVSLSPRVLEDYDGILNRRVIPSIGHMKLGKITVLHIDAIIDEMKKEGLSAGTIRKTHAVMSGIFKLAFKKGLIAENPCHRCTLPEAGDKDYVECFNQDQAAAFLKALTLPYKHTVKEHTNIDDTGKPYKVPAHEQTHYVSSQLVCFFNLAVTTGARRGELIALTWEDVNLEECYISITKSASKTKVEGQIIKSPKTRAGYRLISIPEDCVGLLRKWKSEQKEWSMKIGDAWEGTRGANYDKNYVFIQDTGRMMNLDTPTHRFKEILLAYNEQYATSEEEKLPLIRLHGLRHTNATLLLANGADILEVSAGLGHNKKSTTLNIYSHSIDARKKHNADLIGSLLSDAK